MTAIHNDTHMYEQFLQLIVGLALHPANACGETAIVCRVMSTSLRTEDETIGWASGRESGLQNFSN